MQADCACTMKKNKIQYTLRGVPEQTDHLLRERAAQYGTSLNDAAVRAMQKGLGQTEAPLHHDFDKYAGTWEKDPVVEHVLEVQDRIDPDLWA